MTALTRDQRALRGALIGEAYRRNPAAGYLSAIEEGARQFRAGKRPGRSAVPAIAPQVLAEAVASALARQECVRKEAKKAARRRVAAEQAADDRALVDRMVAERLAVARKFSEASAGPALCEASNADLAFVAAAAMGGRPAAAGRSVVEIAVDQQSLSLQDLAVAAVAGSAGSTAFWTGQPAGDSPFHTYQRGGGASKGTADA
jgi:hypothetical protein